MPPSPDAKPTQVHGILWLASYPKSGNTWTRTFLHNLFALLEGRDEEQDINKINEFTTWDISARAYEKIMGETPTEEGKEKIAAARPKVQAQIAQQTEGLAIVKTHHALVADRGFPTINFSVTSGAVYVVRNPLDVAISFAHHMGKDIDTAIEHMALKGYETPVTEQTIYEVYGSWSENVQSWTRRPHRAIYTMRYEDMLSNPESAFGRLAQHLLLTPNQAQLRTAIARSSFERLRQQEEASGFREKPKSAERFFREGRAGQWRDVLTRRQVRRIISEHKAMMHKFGYLDEDLTHIA